MYRLTQVCTHTIQYTKKYTTGYLGAAKIRWIPRTAVLDGDTYAFWRAVLDICCYRLRPEIFCVLVD